MNHIYQRTLFTWLLLATACTSYAATYNVNSLSALQSRINSAVAGDIIILANGVYTASADITINKQGTSSQPITIMAQSIGGAEIKGNSGFTIVSPARYIIIQGFKFTHSASQATMASGTSNCRWTQNVFETPGDGENLSINGNDHEVDYNAFQHKNAMGRFIVVRGSGSEISKGHHIHHNYFFDHKPQTGNGAESFQFGLSGTSLSSSNSTIEYNLFENCAGENEMVSLKVSAVTFRYNTIRNCPAHLTLRHGNRNLIYGNYFINTPGVRIFGDNHKIFSNHFENCSPAINIGNGGGEVATGDPLTSHDRPDRVVIAFNTLVNNPSNITMSGRTNGLGATYISIVNNIIQGGGAAASFSGPFTNPTWSGNILYNTNGSGAMPSGGYTTANPLLARDATGTFHLQSGSPAINTATGSYDSLDVDMDGQPRSGSFDKGADEVSTVTVINRILTPAMVGPGAAQNPGGTCTNVTASKDDGNVPANVLDNDLNTRWSASGDGEWIQFCLGSAQQISGVQIAFFSGNTRTSSFDILTGNDGVSWSNAATGLVSSGTSLAPETFTFSPRNAKYVRIVGHGNNVNAWNSYTEVKIQTGAAAQKQSAADIMLNNFPNPFTSSTTLHFQLPAAGNTRAVVYDVNGKPVSVPVSAWLPAGDHKIPCGLEKSPAGFYILQFTHQSKTITRKLQKL